MDNAPGQKSDPSPSPGPPSTIEGAEQTTVKVSVEVSPEENDSICKYLCKWRFSCKSMITAIHNLLQLVYSYVKVFK